MADVLTLHQMRVIVAVAEAGSFGAAAEILATSQPNVSVAVSSAERQLGCVLFSRRPVAPTKDCTSVLPQMRRVLAEAARLDMKMTLLGRGPKTFRMAVPTTVRLVYASQMLEAWRREFPRVQVTIMEGEDDEIRQWLATDFVDAGILIDPNPAAINSTSVELFHDEFEGVIQYDHPLAEEDSVSLDDLLDDHIVLSNSGCRSEVESMCRTVRPGFSPYLLVRDMSTLLEMVSSGKVVTILPSICDPILPPGIRPISLDAPVTRTLVATLSRSAHDAQRDLFEALMDSLHVIGMPS